VDLCSISIGPGGPVEKLSSDFDFTVETKNSTWFSLDRIRRRRFCMTNHGLPKTGLIRLQAILAPDGPIPVSRSTWWAGIQQGRYPKPVKLGPRITAWHVEDIKALIERGIG
jgi:prophage regulatory protein